MAGQSRGDSEASARQLHEHGRQQHIIGEGSANMLRGNCLASRSFASDGLLRPQDGPKTAQESPKRGPREPQDGPKSARERSKSGPRMPQDGIFEPPRERRELRPPLLSNNGARDGPKRPPRPPPKKKEPQ
eukprot:364551-Pyramimonas_sp.AAC.1